MHIKSIQSFTGRNIYSHRPVIKMIVDLEDIYDTPTKDIDGFNEEILNLFPGLKKHYCSLNYEGGFADRLKEGTYLAHVTEHLLLELESEAGYEVFYGKTRKLVQPSIYYIVAEYKNERCGIECAKAAVSIINKLIGREKIDVENIMETLKSIAAETELGPSTKAIFEEAKNRGIPVTRLGNESLIQLGYGKYSRLAEASMTDTTSCISADIAGNKQLTKQILMDNDIPVPYGDIAYTLESALEIARDIGYPVVVKPFDGNQGKGVTINICNESQLVQAYREALKYSKIALVEKFITGRDFRVLVVGGRVCAVSERIPPSITGDGIHTIKELVARENSNPLRGDDHEKPLTRIKLDEVSQCVLARQGFTEESVPYSGKTVMIRGNGNLSTGGTAIDKTDDIHPYNCMLAVKAANAVGLDIAGIDITAADIGKPLSAGNGALVEINAAPGLRMHIYPAEGKKRNVAADIVDMMFPEGRPYSIPIVSITGTNGKTTTTRLIRHTLSMMGQVVGMTSTSGIYVGDECILKGDNTGPVSARIVLSDKRVEAAVLETARGGIIRKGLGYDLADVGVVVNISDDHLGLDGLNTLEDLAHVKGLVAEAVKPHGYAVLNADDGMTPYLIKRIKSRLMLFSRSKSNRLILEHKNSGGKAVYVENDIVYIFDGTREIQLMNMEEIPITFGGLVECNMENSLAAISALYSLGINLDAILTGLKTFKPDTALNPGRFNIFDMGSFKVMLDYSHNIAGYSAVAKFIKKIDASRLVGVIGIPGDRLDKNIMDVGDICAKVFSKIYIKEDKDLRGREPGEVADILYRSVIGGGMKKENVHTIYSETKALETAILDAQPGDLIILFYEEFEPSLELVNKLKKELQQKIMVAV